MKAKKIVIVGAGFSGAILARQLEKYSSAEVIILDKHDSIEDSVSGTGLNLNPNAFKTLQSIDPELSEKLELHGLPRRSMKAETMSGDEIYYEPIFDENGKGLATNSGLRIRWADAYKCVREGLPVNYSCEVIDYNTSNDNAELTYRDNKTGEVHVISDIDMIIGADGRYSKIRNKIDPAPTTFIGVTNFRLLIPDDSGDLFEDMELIYNPEPQTNLDLTDGFNRMVNILPRVGIMKMPQLPNRQQMIYIFGNFGINQEIPENAKSKEVLARLFTPSNSKLSAKGKYILQVLEDNASNLHWARMQHTPQTYSDSSGRVLLLGDAAHAIVPTLGQGATLAIEDACVAASILIRDIEANILGEESVREFELKRRQRREFVSQTSIEASEHLMPSTIDNATRLQMETEAWTSDDSLFRKKMWRVWRGAPHIRTPFAG